MPSAYRRSCGPWSPLPVRDGPLNTRDASDPVAHDLDRTVEIIEDAAAAIDEMLRYNRAMKSVAAQGVSHYRAEAQDARREAEALARQVEDLEFEKRSIADRYESRIQELEQQVAQQQR